MHVRVKLKGLAKTKATLADGTVRTYFYAWRGGPRLNDAKGEPLQDPTSPEFQAAFAAAVSTRKAPSKANLHTLIDYFKDSSDYPTNAKTKKDYERYLKMIGAEFGTMPYQVIEDKRSRGVFKQWRDTMKDRPRTADYAWTVLARVLSVAKDAGMIAANVCERGGRLYASDRTEKIWTAEHIEKLKAAAYPEVWAVFMLALWTGQREGDLLALTWSAYDGTRIRLRQSKTGKRVQIPVSAPLKAMLDALKAEKRPSTLILTNTRMAPWTADGFRTSWGKVCARAGIEDLTFHDIRGTAVTRLAVAGCTVPQIASITGHSLKDAEAILDTHYLGGRIELAELAMQKLDAAFPADGTAGEQILQNDLQKR